jgi:AraC-like DNA-binding protein
MVAVCRRITSSIPELCVPDHRIALINVRPYQMPLGWEVERHAHAFYEANIILCGQARDRDQTLEPGHAMLHAPGEGHTWGAPDQPCVRLVLWFDLDPPIHVTVPTSWPLMPQLLDEVTSLFTESTGSQPGWRNLAAARLSLIISRMMTLGELSDRPCEAVDERARLVHTVERFLREHLTLSLKLDDIAYCIGVSVSTLTHRYHQATGVSVVQRLIALRIERVTQLLQHTELSLTEIADQVGLTNAAYLCRLFRRTMRMTPLTYRRQFHALDT